MSRSPDVTQHSDFSVPNIWEIVYRNIGNDWANHISSSEVFCVFRKIAQEDYTTAKAEGYDVCVLGGPTTSCAVTSKQIQ